MRVALFVLLCTYAFAVRGEVANDAYIRSLEGLLTGVEKGDPSRPQLTLKLGDALFNEAVAMSSQVEIDEPSQKKLTEIRRRAITLYREALNGLGGQFAAPDLEAAGKINFQMARLLNDLGKVDEAQKIWTDLAKADAMPDVQRESVLRLAEAAENRGTHESLKQAEVFYSKAILLCGLQDVCSYAHYHLGWVYTRENRLADGIEEMKKALWDSKGQLREEALRDLITFLTSVSDDGRQTFAYVETLAAKIQRDQLLAELGDAYFAHGNRRAGVYVLEIVNGKNPTLRGYIRLMEEHYGFRNWEKFELDLASANLLAAKNQSADVESEKVLRRLTVQLDGERMTQPSSGAAFKQSVLLYLTLFPQRTERDQMIDGWLAAETDNTLKMSQLQVWIREEVKNKSTKEEIRLRKIRASIAQVTHSYPIIIEEMSALEQTTSSGEERREIAYQVAYAQYLNKAYDLALPRFLSLASVSETETRPDKWAIQSEHLALDILGQKKAYAEVVKQARLWTTSAHFNQWVNAKPELSSELRDIQKVETTAEFEWATSLGAEPQALDVFVRNCMTNIFLPQSCANAQVLAVKLGNQKILISVLRKLGKKDELAAELEAAAEFNEAARLLEKDLTPKSIVKDYLKIALLYELGSVNASRDRILKLMVGKIASTKSMGEEEGLILQTLKETELLTPGSLRLPWKKENREYIADWLMDTGRGSLEIQKSLTASCADSGPGWQSNALSEMWKLNQKQNQIHFAGKGSKRKFGLRVAELKQLADRSACYMQSTTAKMRVLLATIMVNSETELAEEIKASPIPDGVDEEAKTFLIKGLAEFAQPFLDKATEFQKIVTEQLGKIEDPVERENLRAKVEAKDETLFTSKGLSLSSRQIVLRDPQSKDVLNSAIQELHSNPNQRTSLTQLKSYYEANGKTRLAAYFQGRLLQLSEEVNK